MHNAKYSYLAMQFAISECRQETLESEKNPKKQAHTRLVCQLQTIS